MIRARRLRNAAVLPTFVLVGFVAGRSVRDLGAVTSSPAPAAALRLDSASALVAGPAHAPVVVRIFGDYGCPACRTLERAVADSLLALARNDRIRLVYLQRPLAATVAGEAMALAVACAPRARAWDVHRFLYRTAKAAPAADLRLPPGIAEAAGFGPCVSSASRRADVRASIAAARAAGFDEVPVVLVNDERIRYRTHGALLRYIVGAIDRR